MRRCVEVVLFPFAISLVCLTGGHVAIGGTDIGTVFGAYEPHNVLGL